MTSSESKVGGQDEYEVINAVKSQRIDKPRRASEFIHSLSKERL